MAAHAVGDQVRAADFLDRAETRLRTRAASDCCPTSSACRARVRLDLGDWSRASRRVRGGPTGRRRHRPAGVEHRHAGQRGTRLRAPRRQRPGARAGRRGRAQPHPERAERLPGLRPAGPRFRLHHRRSLRRGVRRAGAALRPARPGLPPARAALRRHVPGRGGRALRPRRRRPQDPGRDGAARRDHAVTAAARQPAVRPGRSWPRTTKPRRCTARRCGRTSPLALAPGADRARLRQLAAPAAARGGVPGPAAVSAVDAFEVVGATTWAEQARAELRAAGERMPSRTDTGRWRLCRRRSSRSPGWPPKACSNREIGEQLFLSPRTVGSHLYRIFPKLDITSRAQLAARLDGI